MRKQTKIEVVERKVLQKIHDASLRILKETGVKFFNDEAIKIFKKHGAKVDNDIVFMQENMVQAAIDKAPSKFEWIARNPSNSVIVGVDESPVLIHPNIGPVWVQDFERGRRRATLQDFANIQKIVQVSPVVALAGGIPVEPIDIEPKHKHLYVLYETLKHTDKPFVCWTVQGGQANEMLDMIEIAVGGKDVLLNNTYVAVSVDPITPLSWGTDSLDTIIAYAKRKQAIFLPPCVMPGVNGPISLLGSSVLQNTEILSGIVLTQLINPGNPVVYAASSSLPNLKTGGYVCGSPEVMLMNNANLQMARDYYHIPCRTLCGSTDAKTIDCQAGYETMQSLLGGVLGGAHIILECYGVLDSIMTTSFEKMIIDEEIISRVIRIREGLSEADMDLSIDLIQEIGHGGSYLDHLTTLNRFRERWLPSISDWGVYENWQANGSQTLLEKANKKYKKILEDAPDSRIELELDRDLNTYIKSVLH